MGRSQGLRQALGMAKGQQRGGRDPAGAWERITLSRRIERTWAGGGPGRRPTCGSDPAEAGIGGRGQTHSQKPGWRSQALFWTLGLYCPQEETEGQALRKGPSLWSRMILPISQMKGLKPRDAGWLAWAAQLVGAKLGPGAAAPETQTQSCKGRGHLCFTCHRDPGLGVTLVNTC